jgi:hypothetical protein
MWLVCLGWVGGFAGPGLFQPLHVTHLSERGPRAIKYLALPPGWRFLDAPGQENVWYDAALLAV